MPNTSSVLPNALAGRGRSSLHSGLDLLECLAAREQPASLTELTAALGLAKSSVHQLLKALLERGWVQRQPDQRYAVGVRAWETGSAAQLVEIGRVAEPHMAELVRQVNEGVALALLDGDHTVCIQIAESPQVVRVHRRVGERNPAHCVSNGLVLLACLSDEEVCTRLPGKLRKLTAKTIGSKAALLRELHAIRARGHAVCRGAWQLDVGGVAVALRGPDGRAVAGLSIALPLERLTSSHLQRLARGLMATAADIERQIGGPAAHRAQPARALAHAARRVAP